MGKIVSTSYACDYDKKDIPEGEHQTRELTIDGNAREIDFCAKHGAMFDKAIERYMTMGRVLQPIRRAPVARAALRGPSRTKARREASATARIWARDNGYQVSDRGRIPQSILTRFELATGQRIA